MVIWMVYGIVWPTINVVNPMINHPQVTMLMATTHWGSPQEGNFLSGGAMTTVAAAAERNPKKCLREAMPWCLKVKTDLCIYLISFDILVASYNI